MGGADVDGQMMQKVLEVSQNEADAEMIGRVLKESKNEYYAYETNEGFGSEGLASGNGQDVVREIMDNYGIPRETILGAINFVGNDQEKILAFIFQNLN